MIQKPDAVKTEAVPWTAAQVAAGLPAHLAALPFLGAACGLRQGEAFGLAKGDLDFLRRTVHVEVQVKLVARQLHFAPLKNHKTCKARDVPLAGPVLPILAEHIRQHPPVEVTLPWHDPRDPAKHGKPVTRGLVFAWRGREAINRGSFNPVWRRAWRTAGVPDRGG